MLEILMIEDDLELAELLSEYLKGHDMNVTNYDEPYTGISAVNARKFDLLLLDLTLPNLDGLEVCEKIVKQKNIPIIISSARNDVNDKIKALELGADDYIPKPYDPQELVARIHSVLRRYSAKAQEEQQKKEHKDIFEVRPEGREILFKGKRLELTKAEYEILSLLLSKVGQVFSRESIAIETKSINPESSNKSIDVIIGRLRAKIEQNPKTPEYIISVRGVGYKIEINR